MFNYRFDVIFITQKVYLDWFWEGIYTLYTPLATPLEPTPHTLSVVIVLMSYYYLCSRLHRKSASEIRMYVLRQQSTWQLTSTTRWIDHVIKTEYRPRLRITVGRRTRGKQLDNKYRFTSIHSVTPANDISPASQWASISVRRGLQPVSAAAHAHHRHDELPHSETCNPSIPTWHR